MDRARSRENNQNININKVTDKIGVAERVQYDKIDVFVDVRNRDSVWAVIHYTEDRRGKSIPREKVIRFTNYKEMIAFLRNNFDTYELNNRVDYLHRKIFQHLVDYNCIKYYLHDGNPEKNYIEIEYKEYINDGFHIRTRIIPKEYNDMLVDIIKINKNLDRKAKLSDDLYQIVDVSAKKEKNYEDKVRIPRTVRRLEKEKKSFPLDANMDKRKTGIKKLAIISTGVLMVIILKGYVLDKNNQYKKNVVLQKQASIFGKDAFISQNKEKASIIINDLFDGNYDNVSEEDLRFVREFINNVGQSNFDRNNSSTFFEYKDFFSIKFYENSGYEVLDASKINSMLEKIEGLYSNCFKELGGELIFNEKAAERYIDYVATLTFMYNTNMENRSSYSRYASQEDIMAFEKCPPILKYMILNQLKTILFHTNYQVAVEPSNYFGGLDKYGLMNNITKKMDNIGLFMKTQCNNNTQKGI